jgi:hypothetical protein
MLLFGSLALAEEGTYTEKDFLSRTRKITVEGRRAGEGYFSPDGKRMVFQSERDPGNPFYQIYELDLTSGETRRISPGKGKTTCAFFQEHARTSLRLHPPRPSVRGAAKAGSRARRGKSPYLDCDPEMDLYVYQAASGS